ncbi:MAG: hypothetical protein KAI25_15620 [Hyphomicrobiaceae bacterium]|nr:hypothetical protein [Hyphomicrobiaceae bacterium]
MAVTCRPTILRRYLGVIGAIASVGLTAWFIYDGWFNQSLEASTRIFNQVMAFICPIGGIASIIWGIRVSRQSIVLDEAGISINDAEPIALKLITEIDDSTYDKDRYARVKYKDASDDEQTFVLDAQKFDGVDELLDELFDITKLPSKAAQTTDDAPPTTDEKAEPPAKDDADPDK